MNDKTTGSLLLVAAVGILAVYAYGLFFAGSSISLLVLQITAFIAVAIILGLIGWIGYSIATTAPPPPPEPESDTGHSGKKEETSPEDKPPQETKKKEKAKGEEEPVSTPAA